MLLYTGYVCGSTQDTARSLYKGYNAAETNSIYRTVLDKLGANYTLVGWQVKVKFRFDFIIPALWTLSIDEGQSVTDSVPQPHNPYQWYIYTYNSYFKSNPMQFYYTSFEGSVHYQDQDTHQGKDRDFSAITAFNTVN